MAKPLEVAHFLAFVQRFAFLGHASGRGRYVSPKLLQLETDIVVNAGIAVNAANAGIGERNGDTALSVAAELQLSLVDVAAPACISLEC